jgi:hypothetical protein
MQISLSFLSSFPFLFEIYFTVNFQVGKGRSSPVDVVAWWKNADLITETPRDLSVSHKFHIRCGGDPASHTTIIFFPRV